MASTPDLNVLDDDSLDPDQDHAVRLIYVLAGPVRYLSMSLPLAVFLLLICAWLTVISQVYGLVLWLTLPVLDVVHHRARLAGGRMAAFACTIGALTVLSALTSFVVVPRLAPHFGRVALPCSTARDRTLQPQNRWGCFFMRNYATPAVRDKLQRLADAMAKESPGTVVRYLDAGFPFWRHFPMLPHLTHADGRKVDLAFAYEGRAEPPSPIGYWAYEGPREGEERPCEGKTSSLRWDFPSLQAKLRGAPMDEAATRSMIAWLLADEQGAKLKRLVIEPHLKTRLQLDDPRVRFQGCRAARHDDHIHLEL